jgi:hypothetical protein
MLRHGSIEETAFVAASLWRGAFAELAEAGERRTDGRASCLAPPTDGNDESIVVAETLLREAMIETGSVNAAIDYAITGDDPVFARFIAKAEPELPLRLDLLHAWKTATRDLGDRIVLLIDGRVVAESHLEGRTNLVPKKERETC